MTAIRRIDLQNPDGALIASAAALLRAGRLVAYPTETFYGLGADPLSAAAVERVFRAKGRPERMALPLIAADEAAVRLCVREFSAAARKLADAFWPGALTLILPAADALPPLLLGGGRTVGVRISPHPIAAALARATGTPIVATSANRSGGPAPATAQEVEAAMGEEVDLVLDGGPTRGGLASTVLDLTVDPPRVVRAGALPLAALEAVLGRRLD